jgi:hypothetical protein
MPVLYESAIRWASSPSADRGSERSGAGLTDGSPNTLRDGGG